jgi:hypothetical protein
VAVRTGLLSITILASFALSQTGCELVADFDDDKLNEGKTMGPMTIITPDGAVAVVPDGSIRSDAALVRPNDPDASSDAGLVDGEVPNDAAGQLDADLTLDASADPDATAVAPVTEDAATDADLAGDASAADASAPDGGEVAADAATPAAGPTLDAGGLDAAL